MQGVQGDFLMDHATGGTGLRPVISSVALKTVVSSPTVPQGPIHRALYLPVKSGATPDLTGVTPVPPF